MPRRLFLKHKLLIIMLLTVAPFAAYSTYHYFEMLKDHREHSRMQQMRMAEAVAQEMNEMVLRTLAIMDGISRHPSVRTLNTRESDKLFRDVLPRYPFLLNILLANMAGRNVGSAVSAPGIHELNYLDRAWFIEARDGRTVVGDMHISKLFKGPAVMISGPVFGMDGRQAGVIGLPLSLARLRGYLLDVYKPSEHSFIVVTDSRGIVLIDTLIPDNVGKDAGLLYVRNRPMAGHSHFEGIGSDNIERLYSIAKVPDTGWKVILGAPLHQVYGHGYAFTNKYLVVVILITIVTIAMVLLIARKSWKDIEGIIHGIKEIGSGNLAYRISTSSKDELLTISDSINQMAESRMQAESALREREGFLTNVLEGIGEGLIVVDRDYRIISANRAFAEQVQMTKEAIIGRQCFEVSHHQDHFCFENGEDCPVKHSFDTGEPASAIHTHVSQDGDVAYLEVKSFPMKDAEGRTVSVIEVINDITEKKHLEDQLRHAQKMEAVGQLAGGMAHDFNNILTAIVGYANLLSMKISDSEARHYVDQILASTDRASRLTQGLLTYSRKQIVSPKPLDLNETVRRVERFLGRLIGEDIELKTELANERLVIIADSVQIEQVLMNLATNARDAMPDGGTLLIETKTVELDADFIKRHNYGRQGMYALISVTDTGMGMDTDTQKHIFEPFFTTKEVGKGTGLGLSIVYGIVKQHNGYINVYSEPGRGTTFKIYFPLAEQIAMETGPVQTERLAGGQERILIAEDDEAVRKLMKSVLQEFGYKVIEAVDGRDAIEKFNQNDGKIDLLILDVIMPRMNGKEAYDEIVKIRPGTKAIFTSGYTGNIIHKKGVLEEGIVFVSKPVSPTELLRKVREVLDGAG